MNDSKPTNPKDAVAVDSKPTNPKDAVAVDKVAMHVFPATARIAGSMAMLEGKLKYGQYNYRIAGVRASVYYDALMRHMESWWNGEDVDPMSDLPHTWKAIACLAVLIDADACAMLTDDRPPAAPVAKMITDLEQKVARLREHYGHVRPHQPTQKELRPATSDGQIAVLAPQPGTVITEHAIGNIVGETLGTVVSSYEARRQPLDFVAHARILERLAAI